jgi:hypothetical protein
MAMTSRKTSELESFQLCEKLVWKFFRINFSAVMSLIPYTQNFPDADLTLIVALDLEHCPQIGGAHVVVDLESEKERLSEQVSWN